MGESMSYEIGNDECSESDLSSEEIKAEYKAGIQRLEDAMERDPREFPVGILLRDTTDVFYWYKTEEDLLKACGNDWICLMEPPCDEFEEMKTWLPELLTEYYASNEPGLTETLRMFLNSWFSGWSTTVEFLGKFEDLCEKTSASESYIRENFREYIADMKEDEEEDDGDEEDCKENNDGRPLLKSEHQEFIEFIKNQ